MIISGFPGIGKTTIANSFKYRIIDFESSLFKTNKNGRIDNWEEIYCKVANDLSKQGYIVFVSCHNEVRNYFKNHQIDYAVIFPIKELKYEWITKLRKRFEKMASNKNKNALNKAEENYEEFIDDILVNDINKIPITDMEYKLEDLIEEAKDILER